MVSHGFCMVSLWSPGAGTRQRPQRPQRAQLGEGRGGLRCGGRSRGLGGSGGTGQGGHGTGGMEKKPKG